jgi:hypothetical protein
LGRRGKGLGTLEAGRKVEVKVKVEGRVLEGGGEQLHARLAGRARKAK